MTSRPALIPSTVTGANAFAARLPRRHKPVIGHTFALAVFTTVSFNDDHPDTMHRDDFHCAIGNLIADPLHLAHQKGFDPQHILEQAKAHFKTKLLLDDGRQP